MQQSTLTITPAATATITAAVVLNIGFLITKSKRSDTWKDFMIYSKDPTMANCIHYKENISIGVKYWTFRTVWALRAVRNNEIPAIRILAANLIPVVPAQELRRDSYQNILSMMDDDEVHDDGDNNIIDINNDAEQGVDQEILQYRTERKLNRLVEGIRGPDGEPVLSYPFKWWSQKASKYPILSRLAKKILCIPATSALVERLFFVAGITIANDLSRLLPENAEDLIYLHDAWPKCENII